MFILYSAHPPEIKTRIAGEIANLIRTAGDPDPQVYHYSNGVSVISGHFSPAFGQSVKEAYPHVRTIQLCRNAVLDNSRHTKVATH